MDINKVIFRGVKVAFALLLALVIVYATMTASYIAYDFGYRVFTETAIDKSPGVYTDVLIHSSMEDEDIGRLLENKGLVRDATLFLLQYKLSAYSGKIVPGEYRLSTAMTPKEMIIIMSESYGVEETESTGE